MSYFVLAKKTNEKTNYRNLLYLMWFLYWLKKRVKNGCFERSGVEGFKVVLI